MALRTGPSAHLPSARTPLRSVSSDLARGSSSFYVAANDHQEWQASFCTRAAVRRSEADLVRLSNNAGEAVSCMLASRVLCANAKPCKRLHPQLGDELRGFAQGSTDRDEVGRARWLAGQADISITTLHPSFALAKAL